MKRLCIVAAALLGGAALAAGPFSSVRTAGQAPNLKPYARVCLFATSGGGAQAGAPAGQDRALLDAAARALAALGVPAQSGVAAGGLPGCAVGEKVLSLELAALGEPVKGTPAWALHLEARPYVRAGAAEGRAPVVWTAVAFTTAPDGQPGLAWADVRPFFESFARDWREGHR